MGKREEKAGEIDEPAGIDARATASVEYTFALDVRQ
jgi:hypothetical protein